MQEGELNLGIAQTKKLFVIDNTIGAGAQLDVEIPADTPCNVHGLILDVWVGSQVATQHDFGNWALFALPRTASGVPPITTSGVNAENFASTVWMFGNWMLIGPDHNHVGGAPKSSRNCPDAGRLVFSLENSAVSAGAVRVHGTVSWFETRK